MMKLAVVDDNAEERTTLISYIKEFSHKSSCDLIISSYSSGEAFFDHEDLSALDAVFLDIYMDKNTGMDVAKELRERDYSGIIIFCSVTSRYALEGYSVNALNYMIKPITYPKIEVQLEAIEKTLQKSLPCIRIKDGRQWCKVNIRDILYIEKQANYVLIYAANKVYTSRMTLSEMERILPQHHYFVKCDRGIVVNLQNVDELQGSQLLLKNKTKIPISRSNLSCVKENYFDYIFNEVV